MSKELTRTLSRAAGGTLAVVVLVLVFQNLEAVSVRLLFWQVHMSLALLVLLVAALGLAAGLLTSGLRARRRPPPAGDRRV